MFTRARVRLMLWYAATSFAGLVLLGVGTGIGLARSLDEQLDDGIESTVAQWRTSAVDIASLPALPDDAPALPRGRDETFLLVFRADGAVVVNAQRIPAQPFARFASAADGPQGRLRYDTAEIDGMRFRLLAQPVVQRGVAVGTVIAGRSLAERDAELRQLILVLSGAGAVGLVLAVGGGYLLSGRALEPLVEAYERQRHFVSDASHELRAPITVIRTSAELLLRGELSETERSAIEEIGEVAAEAGRLVDDLLDLARMQGGQPAPVPEPSDIAIAARQESQRLAPLLLRHATTVSLDCQPAFARVTPDEVHRIVRSLLENVSAHTPPGTRARVITMTSGGLARLIVEDEGPGVPPEHQAAIFDRFMRLDAARTPGTAAGSGLGLAIVRELAARRGGRVAASNATPRGLRVEVTFPSAT